VLLVPELLSGPKGPAATPPAAGAASPSSEEPPLRSYTINLGDDSHTQSETANGAVGNSGPPQPSQPAQPTTPEKDLTESSSWDASATTDSQAQAATPNSVPANPAPSSAVTTSPQPSAREPPPPHPTAPPNSTTAATQRAPAASRQPTSAAAAASKANQSTHTAAAEKAAPKPHQAAPEGSGSGGWGVQLGVFASKENAERLAVDVRTKGFKVSVSPVTSGKRKLYRVRVGPAADKSAAQDLQSKLKAAGRPGGTVVPYS
jgi:cell division septation protein DedD